MNRLQNNNKEILKSNIIYFRRIFGTDPSRFWQWRNNSEIQKGTSGSCIQQSGLSMCRSVFQWTVIIKPQPQL